MSGLAWAALSLLGIFLVAALGDLVSEEVRGWLDLLPRAVLRLAATRLDPGLRETVYQEEWLPELVYVLRGAESRPITRLIRGMTFALGLLISVRKIASRLALPRAAQPPVGDWDHPAEAGLSTFLLASRSLDPAAVRDMLLSLSDREPVSYAEMRRLLDEGARLGWLSGKTLIRDDCLRLLFEP